MFDCILLKPPGKCVGSPSTLWLLPRCQLCSWWEIPSLPSMIFIIIDNTLDFLSSQAYPHYDTTCSPANVVFCLEVLLSFLSRMLWGLLHLLRILEIVILLSITFFLGPRVVSNRNTDNWTMMCEFKIPSNPIALKWMVNNSILSLLVIESPF